MNVHQVIAKFVGSKAKVLSTVGTLVLAGAAVAAGTPAAHAQVAFGVVVGQRYYAPAPRPVYVDPAYAVRPYGNGYEDRAYWEHRRYEDFRAREWREHENWERQRAWDWDRDFHQRAWGR